MTTWLQGAANRTTDVEGGAYIDMARYCDRVLAPRHCALDHDAALCFRGILILPARQAVDMVPARQHNVDSVNDSAALFVALATALVLAIVVAAFLHSVAGLGAVNSLVETVRMTLVHTRVATRETLSTKKIASGFWRNTGEVVG
jgi:hypothetical protein